MAELSRQRCHHHAQREAVVRCPECGQHFCRECVTEHEERMLCAGCLRTLARAPRRAPRWAGRLLRLGQCLLGLGLAWLFFYLVAESLLALPSSFHEGTLWRLEPFGSQ